VGAGIGYLVARKINNANYDFFVEQAKAKAKAIEFEAEGILRNSKISVQEAEFEAKKKYEDKASKLQKEFNVKFDELGKKEHALLTEQEILKDSYLWDKDDSRALQDPLSYRDASYFFAAMSSSIQSLESLMKIQLNSSDDNPGIFIGEQPAGAKFQESKLFTKGGAVVPTSNFEPLLWVIEFEKASIVLAHNSKASSLRTIRLSDDNFTHLSRFLGTDKTVHAFGAMQKPFVALAGENEFLANPASLDYVPVAGNIEDVATNAPFVMQKFSKQIENFYSILGMELIHAAQAIDLRMQQNPNLKLSAQTKKLYEQYRKVVKFMDTDRPLTGDFRNSAKFLKEYK